MENVENGVIYCLSECRREILLISDSKKNFVILPPPPPNRWEYLCLSAFREVEDIFYPPPILHLFWGKRWLRASFWLVQTYSMDDWNTSFELLETFLSGVRDSPNG